jgi:hypothetical protein
MTDIIRLRFWSSRGYVEEVYLWEKRVCGIKIKKSSVYYLFVHFKKYVQKYYTDQSDCITLRHVDHTTVVHTSLLSQKVGFKLIESIWIILATQNECLFRKNQISKIKRQLHNCIQKGGRLVEVWENGLSPLLCKQLFSDEINFCQIWLVP